MYDNKISLKLKLIIIYCRGDACIAPCIIKSDKKEHGRSFAPRFRKPDRSVGRRALPPIARTVARARSPYQARLGPLILYARER
jgi:hypothetical protein